MKKNHLLISALVVLLAALAIMSCGGSGGGNGPALSNAKSITAFSILSPAATGTIDENAKTISVIAPYGTPVTALVATFTTTGTGVMVNGMSQNNGITINNFTNPVAYVVTAQDASTVTYTVTVTVALNSAKAITAFSILSPAATGSIDENAKTISVIVPYGTPVTALVAAFTTTGTGVMVNGMSQNSGITINNFTNPVAYVVTAQDASTVTYTVTVTVALNSAKAITAFSILSPAATGSIDENAKTIFVTIPHGTPVMALIAAFTTTGAGVMANGVPQISEVTTNNFTTPVAYVVTAEDGSTVTYTVTVIVVAINLPRTGQTNCYDSTGSGSIISCATTTGQYQDGAQQTGVAWPNPRFTNNGDGTATDNLAGLMWLTDANCIKTSYAGFDVDGTAGDGAVSWQHALDFIAGMNAGMYGTCARGYADWRLPNRIELRSLIDLSRYNPALPAGHPFSNLPTIITRYWSSTTWAAVTTEAWYVYIAGGGQMNFDYKTGSYNVWPVRTASTPHTVGLPKTGQTTSYAAGDDGDLQTGVAWPSPRFTVDSPGVTATDNLTGLTWPLHPDSGLLICDQGQGWQGALNFIVCLNSNNYLGKTDWRLPNPNELVSLTDASQYPALPAGHPFSEVDICEFSSSTFALNTINAWESVVYNGTMGLADKVINGCHAWPVRGGQ